MLILSRKVGESIVINDEIEIKITELSGDRVRLGIAAPRDYKIMRQELRQTMESNRQAATTSLPAGALRSLLAALPADPAHPEWREEKDKTPDDDTSEV